MGDRWRRVVVEAGRFLAVGGLATTVALVLFNALVHGLRPGTGDSAVLSDRPVLAYVIANSIGMAISYRGTRRWAFRDRPPHHIDGGRSAFVLVNIVTMGLPVLCLIISRDVLGLDDPVSDNVAANVIGLAMGVTARFWIFRTFVFRRPIHLGDIYPGEEIEPAEDDDAAAVSGPTDRSTAPRRPHTGP